MEDILKEIKDPDAILFIGFISMLYNSGIQQLGKVMNPVTGNIHRDLLGAQSTIEILKMMKKKTEGNLSEKEKSVLDSSLSNLQINYVEELEIDNKKDQAVSEKDAPAESDSDTQDKPAQDQNT